MKERVEQFYVHLRKKRKFHTNPYESHAGRMPGFLGEAAISFAHEWPEARKWMEYATLLYCTSYPAWGGDDGGWQEGPGYWSAYMRFAMYYVIALRNATGVDLMNKPFFRNTPYYALYTATPYHEHRPFGDGAYASPSGLGSIVHAFSEVLEDPYLKWYWQACDRKAGGDLLTLVTADPNLEPKNPQELPSARLFEFVGLSAFHTALGDKENDITFLFRSSPFGSVSHGHADQNAFVIEAFGEAIAPVTGYYPWYSSPHHHNWTRDTRAVNSMLVNGQGQVKRKWSASGEITAFHAGDGYDYVEGEAAPAYGGRLQRFRRHVVDDDRPHRLVAGQFVAADMLHRRLPRFAPLRQNVEHSRQAVGSHELAVHDGRAREGGLEAEVQLRLGVLPATLVHDLTHAFRCLAWVCLVSRRHGRLDDVAVERVDGLLSGCFEVRRLPNSPLDRVVDGTVIDQAGGHDRVLVAG
jgi:hypothetical protein